MFASLRFAIVAAIITLAFAAESRADVDVQDARRAAGQIRAIADAQFNRLNAGFSASGGFTDQAKRELRAISADAGRTLRELLRTSGNEQVIEQRARQIEQRAKNVEDLGRRLNDNQLKNAAEQLQELAEDLEDAAD